MHYKLFSNQSITVPLEVFQHLINSFIAKYLLYLMVYIYFRRWPKFYNQNLNCFNNFNK